MEAFKKSLLSIFKQYASILTSLGFSTINSPLEGAVPVDGDGVGLVVDDGVGIVVGIVVGLEIGDVIGIVEGLLVMELDSWIFRLWIVGFTLANKPTVQDSNQLWLYSFVRSSFPDCVRC